MARPAGPPRIDTGDLRVAFFHAARVRCCGTAAAVAIATYPARFSDQSHQCDRSRALRASTRAQIAARSRFAS